MASTKTPGRQRSALPEQQQAERSFLGLFSTLRTWLASPVSGASLGICRIAFGLIMILEVSSLFRPSQMASGKILAENYYIGPDIRFNFPYSLFAWLPTLSPFWFYCLSSVLALSALLVALGLFYRIAAIGLFLSFGFLFIVESTRTYWQSYYYVELLVAFLILWMPAARRLSVDAWWRRGKDTVATVPFWTIFLLRGQLVVMYFYGGVAKINADWLLDAAPLRWALREPHVGRVFEPFFSPAHVASITAFLHDVRFAYFLSYTGLVFDLAIGFLLLVRRTRILGLILMAMFHATNHFIIYDNIDWFPVLGLATASIFLDPDWPERFWKWARRPTLAKPDWAWLVSGAVVVPCVGATLGWKLRPTPAVAAPLHTPPLRRSTFAFVLVWMTWQILFPLRHYLIPGDARITWEGLSFSWRLKTDEHKAIAPQLFVHDPAVINANGESSHKIDWSQWRGERVLYRLVDPARVDWQQLPEIVLTFEPLIGERLIYNPYSGRPAPRSENESRNRIQQIWRETYGRSPASAWPAVPLPRLLGLLSDALRKGQSSREAEQLQNFARRLESVRNSSPEATQVPWNRDDLLDFLDGLRARDASGALFASLRLLVPFAFDGAQEPEGPFLAVDDPLLFETSKDGRFRLNRELCKFRPAPGIADAPAPLTILTASIGVDAKRMLPQASIYDWLQDQKRPPIVFWNTALDLNISKLDHIANQPFYLRRYARRVASLWQAQYGRRPQVTALTSVSLNHRPYQALVDPEADLASVPVTHLGHNAWIRDLEVARIPRQALKADDRAPAADRP